MHIVVMRRTEGEIGRGRPPKYSHALAREICNLLSTTNVGVREVCHQVGIATETLYAWRHKHPDFSEQVARAMELHYEVMGESLVEHADENVIAGDRSDSARVQQKKVQSEVRRWVLSKRLPHLYGDRLQVSTEVEFLVPDVRPASMVEAGSNSELPRSKPALPADANKASEGVGR